MKIIASAIFLALLGCFATAAADIADDILARAIDQYRAGDVEPAIGGINAALRGRLSGDQLAKAYYYRGLAHRKSGQPGQAITDLTRALEYTGLTGAERSDAQENLEVAYQEAGIAPNEKVVVAKSGNEAPRTASKAPAAFKPTIAPAPTPVTGSVDTASPVPPPAAPSSPVAKTTAAPWPTSTESTPAPAPARAPVAAPAPPSARSASWDSQQVALAPLPPVPKTAKAQTQARAQTPTATKVKPPAEPVAVLPLPPRTPALSPFVTQVSAAPPPPALPPPEVRLLVGEAHSRNEAFALAVRLTSQRGAELGPRRPQIAEMRFADTSVYRLRLGPFLDQGQALALCQSLRNSGYECMSE